ncbi:hypothetical protein V6Z11_D04G098200 [Gossypium hirsutum]
MFSIPSRTSSSLNLSLMLLFHSQAFCMRSSFIFPFLFLAKMLPNTVLFLTWINRVKFSKFIAIFTSLLQHFNTTSRNSGCVNQLARKLNGRSLSIELSGCVKINNG